MASFLSSSNHVNRFNPLNFTYFSDAVTERRHGGTGRHRNKNRRRGHKRRRQHHQPTLPLVFPGHESVTTPMPETTTEEVNRSY